MARSSTFARVYFPLTLLVGAAGLGLTLCVLYHALIVLDPHMPDGSFAIFAPPETPQANPMKLYDSYRIFFVHLPCALTTALMSMVMAAAGVLYLISRHRRWDALLMAAVEVGAVTCLLTMVTGYIWGDFAWGKGWTWEPRLTSTLILWLSFIALMMIRGAVEDERKKRMFSAVYGLATVPLYPLVSRSIEMFGRMSHPESLESLLRVNEISELSAVAKPALILFFLFFLMVRYWQLRLAGNIRELR
ncbi:MAG: cytochrome c biogenesis protein CcsA [Planctomycetaceae bacterium]|nr:cytochrome c biogenesis protein CcsA [Planctomycetaceae bacterium]